MDTDGQPSFTAFTAAAARAAHLIVDGEPVIFADTLAGAMLGKRAEEFIGSHRAHGAHPVLAGARAQVTCRSRYTEDRLAGAVGRGVGQYVILGAGLDTFGFRSGLAARVRVFTDRARPVRLIGSLRVEPGSCWRTWRAGRSGGRGRTCLRAPTCCRRSGTSSS